MPRFTVRPTRGEKTDGSTMAWTPAWAVAAAASVKRASS